MIDAFTVGEAVTDGGFDCEMVGDGDGGAAFGELLGSFPGVCDMAVIHVDDGLKSIKFEI